MNQLPNLNQFLDEVDPQKTIDRNQAAAEISMVVFLESIKEMKNELSDESQDKLAEILQDEKNFEIEKAYDLFKKAGKEEDLIAAADRNINKVRRSYLRAHLKAMTPEKKEKVLAKFPSLKQINLEK